MNVGSEVEVGRGVPVGCGVGDGGSGVSVGVGVACLVGLGARVGELSGEASGVAWVQAGIRSRVVSMAAYTIRRIRVS